jgi:dTDP-4-dehydrorhamnose 3,5-epimerase
MMPFEFKPDALLPEIIHVRPQRFGDARGWFAETFRADVFSRAGISGPFVQDNHSWSAEAGTIRGLHFQSAPHAQGKLVRCVKGRILDVAVDIRKNSPRFGKAMSAELTPEGGEQLFIPRGFAHGFCTLEDDTEVVYKTDAFYAPDHDHGIAHDDPAIGIEWPIQTSDRVLSDKDRGLPRLSEFGDVLATIGGKP